MTFLIDTSILIPLFRKGGESMRERYREAIGDHPIVLARITEMEVLQGCRNEQEWARMAAFFADQDFVEMRSGTWHEAARIYYELRRSGLTVSGGLDCCIAQLALENGLTLAHNDRDFEAIARLRPLDHRRLDLKGSQDP